MGTVTLERGTVTLIAAAIRVTVPLFAYATARVTRLGSETP